MVDPSKPADLPIGSMVDGYVVEAKLGAGGMGAIYRVREPGTEQIKALKIIAMTARDFDPEDGDPSKLAEDRFQREAQVLAKLTALEHPNIIAIHRYNRFGGPGGPQYIVMPLFNGTDLHRWMKTNPSLDRVLNVARQLSSAVGYAHAQGVLHRDLKLSNALINADDKVKLIDFGLAREASDEAHELTRQGTLSGTSAYLAPEYLTLEVDDHDVLTEMWSIGVMLYHLTTHRLPFAVAPGVKERDRQLYKMIIESKYVPVRDLRPDCSVEFAALVHDLLQKNRSKRIANGAALTLRLTSIQTASSPGVAPTTPKPFVPPALQPTKANAPKAATPATDATSSKWTAKPGESGVAAGDAQAEAQLALMGELFEGQNDAAPSQDDDDLHLPDVESGVAPPLTQHARRPEASTPASPARNEPAKPLPPPPLEASMVGQAPPAAVVAARVVQATAAPGPEEDSATPSDTRSRVGRPTFAAAAAAKQTDNSKSALRKLALPGAAAAIVAAVMFAGWQYAEKTVESSKVAAGVGYVDPDTVRQERSAKAELEQLQREKRDATTVIIPLPAPSATAAPTPMATPEPLAVVAPPTVTAPRTHSRTPAAPVVVAAAPPPTSASSPWDDIYGGRDSFNNPTTGTKPLGGVPAATAAATAGVRIPVRLEGAISSSPAGPVIAIVTQETKVGSLTLPTGTQVHGQTAGTSGPRILVNFSFAIVGGQNVPVRGTALTPDNRAGIPGTRSLGGTSDVAAGGAQGAIGGMVDAAAGVIGDNPAGDALRGAGNPVSGKAARLNNEEEVVTTKRGARFVVYVQ